MEGNTKMLLKHFKTKDISFQQRIKFKMTDIIYQKRSSLPYEKNDFQPRKNLSFQMWLLHAESGLR